MGGLTPKPMKNYLISFSYNKPFPRDSGEIQVAASNLGSAVNRGFREFRKAHKGIRMPELVYVKTVKI